jgi:hypothetical protein
MENYQQRDQTKESAKALSTIEEIFNQRRTQRDYLNQQTTAFVEALFATFNTVIEECRQRGITEFGEPRMIDHPAGGGKRALQIPIEDWSVIFVPLAGLARPNIKDEAQIPGSAFKELSGRIAVFIGSEPDANAIYDILILPNGSWFAWGYGWPRHGSTIEETNFPALCMELLASFAKDIRVTWRPRAETTLGVSMDARRRPYTFGLPGDEAAGGKAV